MLRQHTMNGAFSLKRLILRWMRSYSCNNAPLEREARPSLISQSRLGNHNCHPRWYLFAVVRLELPIWIFEIIVIFTEKRIYRMHRGSGLERPPEGHAFHSVDREKVESHEFQ